MSEAAADKQWLGQPRGLSTLFFTEMWERLSYYGMRGILVLFMVDQVSGMAMERPTATAIYGLYTGFVYLLALPGGWIADRLVGQRRAVFIGGMIIALGHFSMAVPSDFTFFLGLILIVIGTGLLKPNVSAIVGDLYPEGGARRDAGFSLFYMGINIGAFAGPLICGFLGENISWHLGFSAAGIGMVFGLIQYKLGDKHLGDAGNINLSDAERGKARNTLLMGIGAMAVLTAVLFFADRAGVFDITLQGFAESTTYIIVGIAVAYFAYQLIFGGLDSTEKKRLIVIFLLFIGAAAFWAGFEQAGSSLNLFADEQTNRTGRLIPLVLAAAILAMMLWLATQVTGSSRRGVLILTAVSGLAVGWWLLSAGSAAFESPASWLQSINPLFIILLAPMFGWLWVTLASNSPSIPVKFGMGLVLLGGGFFVMAWGASFAVQGQISPMWLVVTYFLHTCGELCLSPVGLSSVTKLSPKRLVGQMMGIWFMGSALGNVIAGLAAGESDSEALFSQVAQSSLWIGVFFFAIAWFVNKKLIGDLE